MGRIMAYWHWMVAVTGSVKATAAITAALALLALILLASAVSAIT
jgi:hypothetical protein